MMNWYSFHLEWCWKLMGGGIFFYKTMINIVDRTYRHAFHLQYKNQSNDSKNQIIQKLWQTFFRVMNNETCETCDNKNMKYQKNI